MTWKLASFAVTIAVAAIPDCGSKGADSSDAASVAASAKPATAPAATVSASTTAPAQSASAAIATAEPDAPKPPNPDKSCDPKNDTTCEFHERCSPEGKKGKNGTGKCAVGCPKGLAPGPGGCGKKCAADADCAKGNDSCPDCKKCKLVTEPPRGKICQT